MKYRFIPLFLFVVAYVFSQVGINTNSPKSTLEIVGTNDDGAYVTADGLLIPRVNSLMNANGTAEVAGSDEGELVYFNNLGFYYWDGTLWRQIVSTNAEGADTTGTQAGLLFSSTNLYSVNAGLNATGIFSGSGIENIVLGTESTANATVGNRNTIISPFSASQSSVRNNNVIIGAITAAGEAEISLENEIFDNNVIIGTGSARQVERLESGNILIGTEVGRQLNNTLRWTNGNTIIGLRALRDVDVQGFNTFVGARTTSTQSNLARSSAFGFLATTTKNDQMVLGGERQTEVALNGRIVFLSEGTALAESSGFYKNASGQIVVFDEGGSQTVISPHNFDLIPNGASEPMAWSYYSSNSRLGKTVNVDMTKMARALEKISGEKLVYIQDKNKTIQEEIIDHKGQVQELIQRIEELEARVLELERNQR